MRETLFAVLLTVAAAAFTCGVALLSPAAAFMVGAVLASVLGWFVLTDDAGPGEADK